MKMQLSVRYKTFDQYFSVNIPIAKALNSPIKEREKAFECRNAQSSLGNEWDNEIRFLFFAPTIADEMRIQARILREKKKEEIL